jgi:excisionase family DNA binding protein
MPNHSRKKQAHSRRKAAPRQPDILDVRGIAALLTVSTDTVYELLKSGQMPGRKVGRKWLTTRNAVMRWVEQSTAADAGHRAAREGNREALVKVLQSGAVRVRAA